MISYLSFMGKLVLEKSDYFYSIVTGSCPTVSNPESFRKTLEDFFVKEFDNLEEVRKDLRGLNYPLTGFHLSSDEKINMPGDLPFAISRWPIVYANHESHGEYLLGYVKVK